MLDWDDTHFIGGDGVLIGSDENQEWMLKWWWEHYIAHNTLPVTFFDFGMSKSARMWCERRGPVIKIVLPKNFLKSKEKIPLELQQKWEILYAPTFWDSRPGWFSKSLAFLKTPYDRSVWIDLDCQVLNSIQPLINACTQNDGVAIAREAPHCVEFSKKHDVVLEGEILYNTGVVSFMRHSPLISRWVENNFHRNHEFPGDDDILNRTIFEEKFTVNELSSLYNRRPQYGIPPETVIVHYVCTGGKHHIFKTMQPNALP